jgi:hypothetical protein
VAAEPTYRSPPIALREAALELARNGPSKMRHHICRSVGPRRASAGRVLASSLQRRRAAASTRVLSLSAGPVSTSLARAGRPTRLAKRVQLVDGAMAARDHP